VPTNLIVANNITKNYGSKANPILAVGPVSLEILKGEFVVVLGRSGSGKSTLLNLLAGLDKISSGQLTVGDDNLAQSSSNNLAKYRAKIGVIFQSYNLLPNLNTIENVMMGSMVSNKGIDIMHARDLLKKFGLEHRENANIKTLSGGEKQRVAICRSLIGSPEILFCDEPTGALDTQNENQVKDIIKDLHNNGLTIFMVTHNTEFASVADRTIQMKDGVIVEEKLNYI
jgi:ABC-type lipoprotein export system ATPase subunit